MVVIDNQADPTSIAPASRRILEECFWRHLVFNIRWFSTIHYDDMFVPRFIILVYHFWYESISDIINILLLFPTIVFNLVDIDVSIGKTFRQYTLWSSSNLYSLNDMGYLQSLITLLLLIYLLLICHYCYDYMLNTIHSEYTFFSLVYTYFCITCIILTICYCLDQCGYIAYIGTIINV